MTWARARRVTTGIWHGTPHSPFMASGDDQAPFGKFAEQCRKHYAELVAMDRSIGTLRQGLRDPSIIEWPAKVKPRVTKFPAAVMDIAPTLAAITGLPMDAYKPYFKDWKDRPEYAGRLSKRR